MKAALLTVALAIATTAPIGAKEDRPTSGRFGVDYFVIKVARFGGGEWQDSKPGVLLIETEGLRLVDDNRKHPKTVWVLPWATITAVTASTAREDEDRALSVLLGVPQGQQNLEYVTVTTETADGAEARVLRVRPRESANIVAKINFAVKHATVTP